MSGNIGQVPEDWRTYSDSSPLSAMLIRKGELKKLFKIVNDKQIEFRDRFMPILSQQSNETDETFEARKKRVYNAFVTSMTIQGQNGEMLHGNNESFLDETNLPDQIRSILFSTTSALSAVTGINPLSKIIIFLDFTKPPLLDFGRFPTLPTPNESNFEISSDNELWFSAAKLKLNTFFIDRKTKVNWLHRAAMYDILLYFVGFPFALWAVSRLSSMIEKVHLPNIIITAIYIYSFFLCLMVFRVFFAYSRWVFPKVELETERSSSLRHRAVWAAILFGLLVSAVYDAIKLVIA